MMLKFYQLMHYVCMNSEKQGKKMYEQLFAISGYILDSLQCALCALHHLISQYV